MRGELTRTAHESRLFAGEKGGWFSAVALGHIGGGLPAAIEGLQLAAREPGDHSTRRAAVAALERLGR
jgi:hypothetical protein